jgi:hypothetical protein
MNEYLYLLSNPSMPGLLKIGMTTVHPDDRMQQLFSTGVPEQFVLEYCVMVPDAALAERQSHTALMSYRFRNNREFFKITVVEAIKIINASISNYLPYTGSQGFAGPTDPKRAEDEEDISYKNEMRLKKEWAEKIITTESQKTYLKKKISSVKIKTKSIQEQLIRAEVKLAEYQSEYQQLGPKPLQEKRSVWRLPSKQKSYDDVYVEYIKPWNNIEFKIKAAQNDVLRLKKIFVQAVEESETEIAKIMLNINEL